MHLVLLLKKKKKEKGGKTIGIEIGNFSLSLYGSIYRLITIISLDIPKIKRKFVFISRPIKRINNFIFPV